MKPSNACTTALTPASFSLTPISTASEYCYAPNQFNILFIHDGVGEAMLSTHHFTFSGPCVICVNETERISFKKHSSFNGQLLSFKPDLLEDYYTFNNLRYFDHSFSANDIQVAIHLSIFFNRLPYYKGYLSTSEPFLRQLYKTLDSLDKSLHTNTPPEYLVRDILAAIWRLTKTTISVSQLILSPSNFEVEDVLLYLHNHCDQKITIPGLCKRFHVNRTTLSERFFEATGETIITYLNKYRVQFASILLRETNYSISCIAQKVGFNDTAYFAKIFRKYTHFTPTNYRDLYSAFLQSLT